MNDLRGIKCVDSMFLTFQGAWIVHGIIGTRQYIEYSKMKAKEEYMKECRRRILIGRNADGTRNLIILQEHSC